MNITILTEQDNLHGNVRAKKNNLRTDTAFALMTDSFFLPYSMIETETGARTLANSDLVILVPSKNHPAILAYADDIKKRFKTKIAIMQEGDRTLYQDWSVANQFTFLATITTVADVLFVHNESDKEYFSAITDKPILVIKSTIFLELLRDARISGEQKKESLFIGGNMCRWYAGMDSYLTVKDLGFSEIVFPSMGRKQKDEEELMTGLDKRIRYLPYCTWAEFMQNLKGAKYAIHLMPEAAAGSFSLNCAALGVPCIGNIEDDTQRECFPDLSINVHDGDSISKARSLLVSLQTNPDFYNMVVAKALKKIEEFDGDNRREKVKQDIANVLR